MIVQRGVLTVKGRQFTFDGHLALSSSGARRLVLTANPGIVLADLLVTPDGAAHVKRSSLLFTEDRIRRYVAADLDCIFGSGGGDDCPGRTLGPGHFKIERRAYQLELRILEAKASPQPAALFDPAEGQTP